MIGRITQLFPAWALLFSVIAMVQPTLFVGLKTQIVPLLTIIMLAMGVSLTPSDFVNVAKHKIAIGVGVLLQFSVMPIVALLISLAMGFDSELTVGMVLVGSVAGGTSSNVMAYLAKGNVALSISMTAISTLLGVVLTPFLVELYVGQSVDVPVGAMLISLVKIVLLPVGLGVVINVVARKHIEKISSILPLISMAAIVIVISIVVALNVGNLKTLGPMIAIAVILHNSIGLFAGYFCCRLCGFNETISRTVAFEVGLQNSGLAAALAMKFFTPVAAVPGTIFSVWHNISGSLLAGYWAKKGDVNDSVKTIKP
ncbi:bile acid:sodium symporter family protein [Photobacterium profundum]|uniref:Sodium-dependent transporter n=1 Tax=Photobacterium profundum 3TCK TaxID=314280 RepID=Q1YY40_9GAMM|nr:bile acid:sodium symporter family protein [Photobacterium profundum]EAS41165.1 sodium-dependent transporter [Photobacterium profundum 3TCK]PSV64012.1 bile acid:sodium symporter family protein [Photobacterium profundum]